MKLPIWGYEYLNKGDGQNFIYLKCRSNNGGRAKLSLADVVITKQHIYTCQFVNGKKGKPFLFYQDYLYRFHYERRDVVHYRCRKPGCSAKCKYDHIYISSGVHEHQPDVGYFELLKTKEVLERTIAQDPTETRMNIYQKTIDIRCLETTHIKNYPEAIPPFISIRGHIDRLLKKYRPFMPHSIQDIVLTPAYATSSRSQGFHIPTDDKILVFGTTDMLKLLGAATTIYMDGTFYIVPRLYCQLYSIHVMYENVMIPVIYALLPDKSRETYIQLFHIVKKFCTREGIYFNPPIGQTDFEAAAISALRFVFPNTVIKGCFFHYSQALWRECQALGLVRDYLNDSYVHLVVRRMTTLPFCKEEHMAEVRLSCYSIATKYPSLLRFMEYMDHTWLGETALFPQTIRTRYHVDGPRTNNHLEGFHHALKRKTRSAHPNVYVLIKILIENQNSNDIKLIQIHNGSIVRRANRTYERLNYKIDNLTSMYDRAPLNLLPFF
ncbi:unnamed protein product [Gordionus sp. m RMFG-2023]